jgi:hypothetical protein
MALPTFFIIGAAKSGTTSLHCYLDQHPEIQMSAVKEPNFFSDDESGIPYPPGRVSRREDYEQLFDPRVGVRGEASVAYASYPRRQGAPERIKELVPQAGFIYLVRDPIERTVSHYQHRVAYEGETKSLRDVLGDLSDPYSFCVCPSLYASQLDRYLRHFPQERLLVVDHADLLSARRATLRRIFRFLSVDDSVDSLQFDEELNTSSEHRMYPAGYNGMRRLALAAPLRRLPPRVRRALRRSAERILWPPVETSPLDDDLRARLEDRYSGDVERLRALTGQTFSSWSI